MLVGDVIADSLLIAKEIKTVMLDSGKSALPFESMIGNVDGIQGFLNDLDHKAVPHELLQFLKRVRDSLVLVRGMVQMATHNLRLFNEGGNQVEKYAGWVTECELRHSHYGMPLLCLLYTSISYKVRHLVGKSYKHGISSHLV